jgi:hypothetical protein
VPAKAVLGGDTIHVECQKDVSDNSLFRASEIARADADNLEGLVSYAERTAENARIAAEAVIPVVLTKTARHRGWLRRCGHRQTRAGGPARA